MQQFSRKITIIFGDDGNESVEVKTSAVLTHFKAIDSLMKNFTDFDGSLTVHSNVSKEGFMFCYNLIKNPKLLCSSFRQALEVLSAAHALLFSYLELVNQVVLQILAFNLKSGRLETDLHDISIDRNSFDDFYDGPRYGMRDIKLSCQTPTFTPCTHPKTCLEIPKGVLKQFVMEAFHFRDVIRIINQDSIFSPLMYEFLLEMFQKELRSIGIDVKKTQIADMYGWQSKNFVYSIRDLGVYLGESYGLINLKLAFSDRYKALSVDEGKIRPLFFFE
jgi:hypothetical protein